MSENHPLGRNASQVGLIDKDEVFSHFLSNFHLLLNQTGNYLISLLLCLSLFLLLCCFLILNVKNGRYCLLSFRSCSLLAFLISSKKILHQVLYLYSKLIILKFSTFFELISPLFQVLLL